MCRVKAAAIKDQMKATCNTSPALQWCCEKQYTAARGSKMVSKGEIPCKEACMISERRVEISPTSGAFGLT